MPTILRVDGFRFYFYSHEPNEPPHVHIDKDAATAKVWLLDILPALKDRDSHYWRAMSGTGA